MHGDHSRLGERQHARRARSHELADRGQRRLGGVQHHVAVPARLDDGAQHRRERRGDLVVAGDEHRFRLEQHAERAQAVRAQRVAGRDEVDDRVGEPEPRRDLDRAGDVDERHVDGQQLARQARIDGCDGRAAELLEPVTGDSSGTAASSRHEPKPSGSSSLHVGAALAHEVDAGDAAVDDAVLHVLGHVGGAHEQDLDRRVAARERERALAGLLGAEAGVLEQVERRFAQPALDRDGDPQEAERSSASR